MSLVVTHNKMGVYLGSCVGMDFWSKGNAVGMGAAMAFKSEQEALDHFSTVESPPDALQFITVEADLQDGRFASMAACECAGIETWACDDNDDD
ncbi:MAG: hypothetical protein RSG77_19615 [Hafnia sp.]